METIPLSFLARKIAPYLEENEKIPLFGQMPSFDWESLNDALQERFGDLTFYLKEQKNIGSNEIFEGLGPNPEITPILLSPLAIPLLWVMPRSDMTLLCSTLLTGKSSPSPFASHVLQDGYYRYLLLEALYAAKTIQPLSELSPQLSDREEVIDEKAFCIDVEIGLGETKCWGRLVIPDSLKKGLIAHFSELPDASVVLGRAREIELPVSLQVGHCNLTIDEWKTVEGGDAIFLDRASYEPDLKQGVATIMLGKIPIFQARIEQNRITILEYAFYNEESMEGEKIPEDLSTMTPDVGEEVVAIQNYPVTIAVEVGRLKITLEQLMRLSAGNTLELPIQPNQGVALTVNGRLIGRGELVSFNDALAVRILEIAK